MYCHWRTLAAQIKSARRAANRAFTTKVAPNVLVAWQQHVREESEMWGSWNDRRIIAVAMSAWRRTSHNLRRDAFLVESCRAVSAARLQERVLVAWKQVAEEELVCLHASRRRSLALRPKMFAHWRAKNRPEHGPRRTACSRAAEKGDRDHEGLLRRLEASHGCQAHVRNVLGDACEAWSQRLRSEAYFCAANRVNVLNDCVNAWSLVVHQAREERRLAAVQEKVEVSRLQRLLRTSFAGLRRTAEIQRSNRLAQLQAAYERHRIATLNGSFSYLRAWAAHRAVKVSHLRVKWSYDDPLRAAIFAWQAAIGRRQEMEARMLLCDKLRRVVRGTSSIGQPQPRETSSPIKSATYLAADMAELSFAESAYGETPARPGEHDDAQTTAISL